MTPTQAYYFAIGLCLMNLVILTRYAEQRDETTPWQRGSMVIVTWAAAFLWSALLQALRANLPS